MGQDEARPILPWRLVAGAFLHVAVPAYLIALLIAGVIAGPHPATPETVLRAALPFTARFLGLYALVMLAVSLLAAAADPVLRGLRARRRLRDPGAAAHLSRHRVADALAQARQALGAGATASLTALDSKAWRHADPRFQALSANLEEVVRTASSALAAAELAQRGAIVDMATGSLGRIAAELARLDAEVGRRAQGDMRAVARYIETRYGPSDFSGGQD